MTVSQSVGGRVENRRHDRAFSASAKVFLNGIVPPGARLTSPGPSRAALGRLTEGNALGRAVCYTSSIEPVETNGARSGPEGDHDHARRHGRHVQSHAGGNRTTRRP